MTLDELDKSYSPIGIYSGVIYNPQTNEIIDYELVIGLDDGKKKWSINGEKYIKALTAYDKYKHWEYIGEL